MTRRYFDWAAAAVPDVLIHPGTVPFGNPSSPHGEGRAARAALEEARARCAAALQVKPEELIFTSGGTESNAAVLFSLLRRPRRSDTAGGRTAVQGAAETKDAELLYSAVEHPSVQENCTVLAELGLGCAVIPVDGEGRVTGDTLAGTLKKHPRPKMAAIMAVNNETGAVNDLPALVSLIRNHSPAQASGAQDVPRTHIHCDLVQAAGKIPVNPASWGIDSASISAHKIGGPRGTGLLWLRKPLLPLVRGGGQEGGIRPGTENTAGALALARALETRADPAALKTAGEEAVRRMEALIGGLEKTGVCILIPAGRRTGISSAGNFSPWILQAAFRGRHGIIPGEVMVRFLDERGFAVSTGSACSSAKKKRPVLTAMGIDRETAFGGIRISQGWSTT
ncbi:MAG: aminotransferase class V-fold PLP-dependent enzyme, partial [Spirochaetaceae bacterium]|nr:aminotransferase class V-fold PLP-dependent enzyme [Spirochaetaceae bacterium]